MIGCCRMISEFSNGSEDIGPQRKCWAKCWALYMQDLWKLLSTFFPWGSEKATGRHRVQHPTTSSRLDSSLHQYLSGSTERNFYHLFPLPQERAFPLFPKQYSVYNRHAYGNIYKHVAVTREGVKETWITLCAANLSLLLWKLTSTFSHVKRDRPINSSSASRNPA